MARLRHDPSARGLIYEPFWEWLQAGQPDTEEAQRRQFSGYSWWLDYMYTRHWHPCCECGESIPERLMRLLTIAVKEGLVGMADDERIGLDDRNTQAVIAVLDELEPPSSWEWWRDHDCPARKKLKLEVV